MTLREIKTKALEDIDLNRESIINLGKEIFAEPEVGYK